MRMADDLKAKGMVIAQPSESFIVDGKKGPIRSGELDRAVAWARKLIGMG
jgi:hypothetical protein